VEGTPRAITGCTMSSDGTSIAFGFTGSVVYTSSPFNLTEWKAHNQEWKEQSTFSENTVSLASSADFSRLYASDALNKIYSAEVEN